MTVNKEDVENENSEVEGWHIKEKNMSYYFILPMLGKPVKWYSNITNVFVGSEEFPEYDNHIFLLFTSGEMRPLQENLLIDKNLFYTYTATSTSGKYISYIYEVPKRWQHDYDLLVKGLYSHYSKLSVECKEAILKYNELSPNSTVVKIFSKDEAAYVMKEEYINHGLPRHMWTYIPREQEAASKFDMKLEVLHKWMLK